MKTAAGRMESIGKRFRTVDSPSGGDDDGSNKGWSPLLAVDGLRLRAHSLQRGYSSDARVDHQLRYSRIRVPGLSTQRPGQDRFILSVALCSSVFDSWRSPVGAPVPCSSDLAKRFRQHALGQRTISPPTVDFPVASRGYQR